MNMNSKRSLQKVNGGKLIVLIAAHLLLTSSIASAQDFEKTYERALLDSAYRFELLKPAYTDLKIVTSLQNEQYQTAKRESVLEKQVCEMQIKRMQNEINTGRKKSFWKGFKVGSIIVIIVTTSLFLL